MKRYTIGELEKMPTLRQSQADDLKIETDNTRVWLSRIDDSITVEKLVNHAWELVETY